MLAFHWGSTNSPWNNLPRMLPKFMLAPLIFTKCFGSWCKDEIYSQNDMLAFPLFHSTISWWWFPTLYVIITTSGCLLLQINIHQQKINTQHYMLAHLFFQNISMETYKWIRREGNSQHSMLYLNWKNRFTVKYFTRDMTNIYVKCFDISQKFWFLMHIWEI